MEISVKESAVPVNGREHSERSEGKQAPQEILEGFDVERDQVGHCVSNWCRGIVFVGK